jgi:hypothetical protein
MAYVDPDYKSKKDFKAAVVAGKAHRPYNPAGGFNWATSKDVTYIEYVEGPHYPKPHTWYAKCEVRNGIVVSVK